MKSNAYKASAVRHLSDEATPTMPDGRIHQMRKVSPGGTAGRAVFTIEEHCRVHQQIERRAHELWCAGGCRHGAAANDWLQAEREVLGQFIGSYVGRRSLPQSSSRNSPARVARKQAEPRILKRLRTIPQATSAPVVAAVNDASESLFWKRLKLHFRE